MTPALRRPSRQQLQQISEELRIANGGRAALNGAIMSTFAALSRHQAMQSEYEVLGGRDGVIRYFEGLAKTLQKLDSQMSATNLLTNQRLKSLYPGTLATLLDHRVFAKHAYTDLAIGLEVPCESSRVRLDRGEGFELALAELTERKGRAAAALAPELLRGLVRELADPIMSLLDLERRHRGGRPANAEREFVIDRMAAIFPQVTGLEPTSSPCGPFVTLCDRVLEALGLGTDGLETAVQRRLKALRPRRRPASS